MSKVKEKLEPCRCGGEATIDGSLGQFCFAMCKICYAATKNYSSILKAIKAWNTKAGAK